MKARVSNFARHLFGCIVKHLYAYPPVVYGYGIDSPGPKFDVRSEEAAHSDAEQTWPDLSRSSHRTLTELNARKQDNAQYS